MAIIILVKQRNSYFCYNSHFVICYYRCFIEYSVFNIILSHFHVISIRNVNLKLFSYNLYNFYWLIMMMVDTNSEQYGQQHRPERFSAGCWCCRGQFYEAAILELCKEHFWNSRKKLINYLKPNLQYYKIVIERLSNRVIWALQLFVAHLHRFITVYNNLYYNDKIPTTFALLLFTIILLYCKR